jgi:hypothetical protein
MQRHPYFLFHTRIKDYAKTVCFVIYKMTILGYLMQKRKKKNKNIYVYDK